MKKPARKVRTVRLRFEAGELRAYVGREECRTIYGPIASLIIRIIGIAGRAYLLDKPTRTMRLGYNDDGRAFMATGVYGGIIITPWRLNDFPSNDGLAVARIGMCSVFQRLLGLEPGQSRLFLVKPEAVAQP